jgi:hypothetical protein
VSFRRLSAVLALSLALAGCASTPLVAGSPTAVSAPTTTPAADPGVVVPPTEIRIPSIGASSTLTGTGLNPDGTAEVPPVDEPLQASYLDWSDEIELERPLVVYGHVNGRGPGGKSVPGVFARLDQVRPGAEVQVTRADGAVEVYVVSAVESISKASFPTDKVYDIVNKPAVRIITCTGLFDPVAGHYKDNYIVYAEAKNAA